MTTQPGSPLLAVAELGITFHTPGAHPVAVVELGRQYTGQHRFLK